MASSLRYFGSVMDLRNFKNYKLCVYLPDEIGDELKKRAESTNLSLSSYAGLILLQSLADRHSCLKLVRSGGLQPAKI